MNKFVLCVSSGTEVIYHTTISNIKNEELNEIKTNMSIPDKYLNCAINFINSMKKNKKATSIEIIINDDYEHKLCFDNVLDDFNAYLLYEE